MANDTGKPETTKLMIIAGVIVAAGLYFAYSKHEESVAAAARMQAVNAYVNQDPYFQMILAKHKAARRLIIPRLGAAYEKGGEEAMETSSQRMVLELNPLFISDFNWYAKSDAVHRTLAYEYAIMQKIMASPKAKKNKLCKALVHGSLNYKQISKIVGKDTADNYLKARRYIILSAHDHKLNPVWPGATNYQEALTTAMSQLAQALFQFDPQGRSSSRARRCKGGNARRRSTAMKYKRSFMVRCNCLMMNRHCFGASV